MIQSAPQTLKLSPRTLQSAIIHLQSMSAYLQLALTSSVCVTFHIFAVKYGNRMLAKIAKKVVDLRKALTDIFSMAFLSPDCHKIPHESETIWTQMWRGGGGGGGVD